MPKIESEFLNVRQAAQFLNVSEISIRRWTDAGKLSCLRIGGRRERRFKKRDLTDFLEIQSSSRDVLQDTPRASTDNNASGILLEGMAIRYGSHLCTLYETDIGRVKLSVPFLADGLRAGDKCFLVASAAAQKHIIGDLMEIYSDTGSAIRDARLVVTDGVLTGNDLYEYFEQAFLAWGRHGGQHIRVLGDMAWAVEKGLSMDDLMEFEMRYNHTLAKKFALVSLCQYDARKFSGTTIVGALKNHEDTFQFPLSRFVGF